MKHLSWILVLSIASPALGQPKGYRVPMVDLKEQIIWGSTCAGPDGLVLGFGGQDQKADELPRTRIKVDGEWRSLSAELRKRNQLQPLHGPCQALAKRQKDLLALARQRFFAGGTAAEQTRQIEDLLAKQSQIAVEITAFANDVRKLAALKTNYEEGQVQWVVNWKLRLVADTRGATRPTKLLQDGKLVEALKAMAADQIELEQAAEALDAEPPGRFLSPLVFRPKCKRFVLFGGDHGDYVTNDVWLFDPAQPKWEQRHPDIVPPPRANHTARVSEDGTIIVSGGHQYTSTLSYNGGQYRELTDGEWIYDVPANNWKGTGKPEPQNTRLYRTGPFLPEYFYDGPKPDATAHKKILDAIPANRWVEMKPPQKPELMRTWGTAVFDPDGDQVLVFSGGHSAHCGSDVLHYHLGTNRWELPFPVEFPLGQTYSNTSYPDGFNLNRRPWVTGHTYQSYGYDPVSKKMYFVGHTGSCFVYDPVVGDWVGRIPKPKGMIYGDCYYTLEITPTPQGLFCWTGRGETYQLEGGEWKQVKTNGAKLPGAVVDSSTLVHDSKRDRILIFRSEYGKKYDGSVFELDRKTGTVAKASPKNAAALAAVGVGPMDRAVYDPQSDLAIFATLMPGDVSKVRRSLAYDCAANQWVTVNIDHAIERGKRPAFPMGEGHSCGLMFDAQRGLIWGVDTHERRVYALRFERAAAELKAVE